MVESYPVGGPNGGGEGARDVDGCGGGRRVAQAVVALDLIGALTQLFSVARDALENSKPGRTTSAAGRQKSDAAPTNPGSA